MMRATFLLQTPSEFFSNSLINTATDRRPSRSLAVSDGTLLIAGATFSSHLEPYPGPVASIVPAHLPPHDFVVVCPPLLDPPDQVAGADHAAGEAILVEGSGVD